MTNYIDILKQHASPDVIAANPELFDNEQLSAAVSNGSETGHVSITTNAVPTEHQEQAALFAWAAANREEFPELENLYANVNGQYRAGQRPEAGLIAGVPDITLAWPSDGYPGLYIELKRLGRQGQKNGGLSDAQLDWVERLRHAGYYVAVCYGAYEAIDVIERYLDRTDESNLLPGQT